MNPSGFENFVEVGWKILGAGRSHVQIMSPRLVHPTLLKRYNRRVLLPTRGWLENSIRKQVLGAPFSWQRINGSIRVTGSNQTP